MGDDRKGPYFETRPVNVSTVYRQWNLADLLHTEYPHAFAILNNTESRGPVHALKALHPLAKRANR